MISVPHSQPHQRLGAFLLGRLLGGTPQHAVLAFFVASKVPRTSNFSNHSNNSNKHTNNKNNNNDNYDNYDNNDNDHDNDNDKYSNCSDNPGV